MGVAVFFSSFFLRLEAMEFYDPLKNTTSRALSSPRKVKQRIRPKHFPPRSPLAKTIRPTKKFLAQSWRGVCVFFALSQTNSET